MLSAARNAPITIMRPDAAVSAGESRRSPSAPGDWRHHADIRQAWAASATERPGRSLIGRTPRYQNNGHDAVIAVAASASKSSVDTPGDSTADGTRRRMQANTRYKHAIASSPPSSDTTESDRASIVERGALEAAPPIAVAILPSAM